MRGPSMKCRNVATGSGQSIAGRSRPARVTGLVLAVTLLRVATALAAGEDAAASVADPVATDQQGAQAAPPTSRPIGPELPPVSSAPPSIELLGQSVAAGEHRQLLLALGESFAGMSLTTPVQVVHGRQAGPTVCLVAGIHGDEVVGIEVVRRLVGALDASVLRGTVLAVPIANPLGFRRSSRYLPDRRDLNRYFPGRPYGSAASRLAHRIFEQVIRRCHVLVDFHSGSFHRTNLPQVRADLSNPALLGMAQWFGVPVVVHSEGRVGTLRRAANDAGILAVLYEAGEPQRFDEESVSGAVLGALSLLGTLGMTDGRPDLAEPSDVFRGSHWVRAEDGGIFLSIRELGDWVTTGTKLGSITDPFTNERSVIEASRTGRIIGVAHDQVVIPGYALYHVGTSHPGAEEDEIVDEDSVGEEFEERPE